MPNFMDMLEKQTSGAKQALQFMPAPEKITNGPIRVKILQPVFIYGSRYESGAVLTLANGEKEFMRRKLKTGGTRKVYADGKEYITSYIDDVMQYLGEVQDLSAPGKPPQGGDTQGSGAPATL